VHLAEVLALSIFAILTRAYLVFAAKVRWLELWLDGWQINGAGFALAVVFAEVSGAVVAGLFLTRHFHRITRDLRLRIASMERDTALEQTNEQKVREAVEAAMRAATEDGESLTLILADIDDFRRLNNEYSYDIGTFVLRQFARLLRSNIRGARDRVMRYFERGDEFLIILPGTDLENAHQGVAERLRKLIHGNRFLLSGRNTEASFTN
jgi:diguanylate cyclase (GGDEF)-like protein